MELKPVQSSFIAAHGYDPVTKHAVIEFKSGGSYRYENVSQEDYQALCDAESCGKHFHSTFKTKYKGSPHV